MPYKASFRPSTLVLLITLLIVLTQLSTVNSQRPFEYILSMSWNPTGDRLVLASFQRIEVRSANMEVITTLQEEYMDDIQWSPDGNFIAGVTYDLFDPEFPVIVKVWDGQTYQLIHEIRADRTSVEASASLEWHPTLPQVVVSGRVANVWDVTTGDLVQTFEVESDTFVEIYEVHWALDGTRMAAASNRGLVVWDATSGEIQISINGILDFAWSPDSTKIASGATRLMRIYDASDGTLLQNISIPGTVAQVEWLPEAIVSSTSEGMLQIWDSMTYEEITTLSPSNANSFLTFAINPIDLSVSYQNGMSREAIEIVTIRPLAGSIAGIVWEDADQNSSFTDLDRRLANVTVELYTSSDLVTPIATTTTQTDGTYNFAVDPGSYRVRFIARDVDSLFLTIEDSEDSSIIDAEGYTVEIIVGIAEVVTNVNGGIRHPLPEGTIPFLDNSANAQTTPIDIFNTAWRSDGQLLAIAANNGLWLFDPITGIYELLDDELQYDVSWNAADSLLAAIGLDPDPHNSLEILNIWDTQQNEIINTYMVSGGPRASIEFNPIINNYITMSGGTIVVLDINTGERIIHIIEGTATFAVKQVRWSPNGEYLATTHLDCIHRVWELSTGNLVHEFPTTSYCNGLAWSSDGNHLVIGDDGNLQIWNLSTSSPIKELVLSTEVYSLGDDMDWIDTNLFVPTVTGIIEIWNTEAGEIITTLGSSEYPVFIPKINPNGRDLALVYYNGETLELDMLQPLLGSISGIVWEDADLNSSFTDLDRRRADVIVELYISSDLVTPIATTMTQTDGSYSFSVDPGNYRVKFIAPDGDSVFLTLEDSDDSSIIDAQGYTSEITLGPAEIYEDLDAGIKPPWNLMSNSRQTIRRFCGASVPISCCALLNGMRYCLPLPDQP